MTGRQHLVLVGGGHAHVQVIKALNYASRPQHLDVTLIDMSITPTYSGMVPGAVAGWYSPQETQIQLQPLAQWAGIRLVHKMVVDIDVNAKVVLVESVSQINNENNNDDDDDEDTSSPSIIPFDVISIDIGSTSRGLDDIPGAREYTIPTRPIADLVQRMEAKTQELLQPQQPQLKSIHDNNHQQPPPPPSLDVVVVGAGAAGVELSMSIRGRWAPIVGEKNIQVTVLDAAKELLPDDSNVNRKALQQRLQERNISVQHNIKVKRVECDHLILESGDTIPFTHCVWAAGATSHPLAYTLQNHGLAITECGWIRVNQYLQSFSHPYVFAAGDCSSIEIPGGSKAPPPKAGVFAVRAGPVLIENLTAYLKHAAGQPNDSTSSSSSSSSSESYLKPYQPQEDFMKLLVCGDGKALGFRFGIPIYGKWVLQLKDTIDRSFMGLFKKESLSELIEGQPFDTSQYDTRGERPLPLPPSEAAALLQRTDDNVDFQHAWNAIRDMAEDDNYKRAVLKHMTVFYAEMSQA
jgi:selenide, water dikinase